MDAQPSSKPPQAVSDLGQITLVLQGGGALGAYQGGVYQAMHERGMEPDWIIGTSIGAINASLIAGNSPEKRVGALKSFWHRVGQNTSAVPAFIWTFPPNPFPAPETVSTLVAGVPGFFEPNLESFLSGPQAELVSAKPRIIQRGH
jgi:NTE family protein